MYASSWAAGYDQTVQCLLAECETALSQLKLPASCCDASVNGVAVNPYVLLTTAEWERVQNTAVSPDTTPDARKTALSSVAQATLDILRSLPIDILVLRWVNYQMTAHGEAPFEVRLDA